MTSFLQRQLQHAFQAFAAHGHQAQGDGQIMAGLGQFNKWIGLSAAVGQRTQRDRGVWS